jgi:hypothetical protein
VLIRIWLQRCHIGDAWLLVCAAAVAQVCADAMIDDPHD